LVVCPNQAVRKHRKAAELLECETVVPLARLGRDSEAPAAV
jgi:hypothetical protein